MNDAYQDDAIACQKLCFQFRFFSQTLSIIAY
jgi:hypothetical protein